MPPADRNVREIAQKRLKAIEQYSMLGAGFKIAMRDLEIRGAGNLLGAEQSGHIAAVGYEMYCHLLEDAVHSLKNERPPAQPSSTSIEIGITGTIPKPYIPSDARRLEAYRRIATATTPDSLKQVETDLTAAYGAPPRPVQRLLEMAAIRIAAASLDVRTITIRDKDVIFRTPTPQAVADRLNGTDRPAPRSIALPGDGSPKSTPHATAHGGIGRKPDASPKSPQRPPGSQRAAASTIPPPPDPATSLPGTVTILPPKSTADLSEVYFRPPEAYMKDPETLLAVLRKRVGAA